MRKSRGTETRCDDSAAPPLPLAADVAGAAIPRRPDLRATTHARSAVLPPPFRRPSRHPRAALAPLRLWQEMVDHTVTPEEHVDEDHLHCHLSGKLIMDLVPRSLGRALALTHKLIHAVHL